MNFKVLLALFLALASVEMRWWRRNSRRRSLNRDDLAVYRQYHYRDYDSDGYYKKNGKGKYGYGGFNGYYGGFKDRFGFGKLN